MNILVVVKMVPDLVEELSIDSSGAALDTQWLHLIPNEFDEFAVEQAVLLKERAGAAVTVVAPDADGVEDALYTAAAKGADRLIKLTGETGNLNSHALAQAMTLLIPDLQPDLVLAGVQAHNDLDGQSGALLAGLLDWPYVGYVSGVQVANGKVMVRKEYPGGLLAEMEVDLPAVLGIQASDEPPRYVAFSKVRQAMQSATIEKRDVGMLNFSGGAIIGRMFQPEAKGHAEMLSGDAEQVATRLIEIMQAGGLL